MPREATPDDVARIRRVAERGWNAAYEDSLSQRTIDTALANFYDPAATRAAIESDDGVFLVAEREGRVVGYVMGDPADDPGVATLGAIYVAPSRWGEGIGSALLGAFEDWCRDRGYDALRFRVLAENDVGRSFYRSHGYEAVDERETALFGESVRELVFRGSVQS
ncbi:MAG: N-acetyltransferase family protein [Halobacteriaceae archaeon]